MKTRAEMDIKYCFSKWMRFAGTKQSGFLKFGAEGFIREKYS